MILINGCSFSAPTDESETWVAGFYDKGFHKYYDKKIDVVQDLGVKNVAGHGASNTVIRRKTFWYTNNRPFGIIPDYVIIQWSTIDRWDYPVFITKERANGFPRIDQFPNRIGTINYIHNGTDIFGYAKDFYEKYYSLYGAIIETIENIYHTQQYLENNKIPYKMITIGNLMDMDATVEKLKILQTVINGQRGDYSKLKSNKNLFERIEPVDNSWHELDIVKSLLSKIDFTKFIFTDDKMISGFGGGIIEWFLNKNEVLTGGAWHPSEEQHLRFFNEFLWPKIENEINEVVKRNINKRILI